MKIVGHAHKPLSHTLPAALCTCSLLSNTLTAPLRSSSIRNSLSPPVFICLSLISGVSLTGNPSSALLSPGWCPAAGCASCPVLSSLLCLRGAPAGTDYVLLHPVFSVPGTAWHQELPKLIHFVNERINNFMKRFGWLLIHIH